MKNSLILAIALLVPTFVMAANYKANLNDAQIAAIAVAANQVDIDAGKAAESKSSNQEVKAFAHRMITDHTDVINQATALVTKLKVTPEESTLSKSLKSDGQKNLDRLTKMDGKAFNKAYIYQEIAFHKQVLDVIDNMLLPSAKNEELKALLVKVRGGVTSHLEHAEKIQPLVDEVREPGK
jgi:putative membrane protein